jgi:hypothetical protein
MLHRLFSRRVSRLGLLSCLGFLIWLAEVPTVRAAHRSHASTIRVTNASDSGPGSLRQAIAGAQPGDTIVFDLLLPATIRLTRCELVVDKSLNISGPGPQLLAISGNKASRVFRLGGDWGELMPNTVKISGLTIRDASGETDGGGLRNNGAMLTLLLIAASMATRRRSRLAVGCTMIPALVHCRTPYSAATLHRPAME